MSARERDRLKTMEQVKAGMIGTAQAAERLGISQRQAQRILKAYVKVGDRGLVHGLRGRRANNALGPAVQRRAMEILSDPLYRDYGPTLASQTLAAEQGIDVSRETMRRWMRQEGLWKGSPPERKHRHRRPRRRCLGELVQMDTSEHDWLEGRSEPLNLITMIDDATGYKLERFARSDTTATNMEAIGRWLVKHGRPCALYTDWASHFKQRAARGKRTCQTQIERALKELGIELIAAHSPQAKGRVERSHGTDQDRLVKGLRRAGVCTLEEANDYLEKIYLPEVNARFAKTAADPADAHRSAEGYDLEAILCVQEKRRVQNDWTVSIDGVAWQIESGERTGALRGQQVIVEKRLEGGMRLRWRDRYLKFHRAPSALETKMKRTVDVTACGQIRAVAPLPGICPQALDNSKRGSMSHARSYPQVHSPDDEDPLIDSGEFKELRKPVRIEHRTRKPKPNHPWR